MTVLTTAQFAISIAVALGYESKDIRRITTNNGNVIIYRATGYTTYHKPAHQNWLAQDNLEGDFYQPTAAGCEKLDTLDSLGLMTQVLYS